MCSLNRGDVFSFWANVFSFRPDVFTFRPDVFIFEGQVFSEEGKRAEGREVRRQSGVRSACVGGRVAGCAGSDHGAGSRPRTPGWRREDGDVSTLAGRCVTFSARCVHF